MLTAKIKTSTIAPIVNSRARLGSRPQAVLTAVKNFVLRFFSVPLVASSFCVGVGLVFAWGVLDFFCRRFLTRFITCKKTVAPDCFTLANCRLKRLLALAVDFLAGATAFAPMASRGSRAG